MVVVAGAVVVVTGSVVSVVVGAAVVLVVAGASVVGLLSLPADDPQPVSASAAMVTVTRPRRVRVEAVGSTVESCSRAASQLRVRPWRERSS